MTIEDMRKAGILDSYGLACFDDDDDDCDAGDDGFGVRWKSVVA